MPDIDRALSRLALDRDGPRDMTAIRAGLEQAERIAALLAEAPPLLARGGGGAGWPWRAGRICWRKRWWPNRRC